MKKYFWIVNVLHTEGILTGLKVKKLIIFKFCNLIPTLSIPLFPISYNRKTGLHFRAIEQQYKSLIDKLEG